MIPFLGFRKEYIDNNGMPCSEKTNYQANVLQFEWFGVGWFLYVGEIVKVD